METLRKEIPWKAREGRPLSRKEELMYLIFSFVGVSFYGAML
jgi:hypothetical protein